MTPPARPPRLKHLLWPIVVILAVVAIDQVTKLWALDYLTGRGPVQVLGDFFRLTLVFNFGGAMGTKLGPSLYYLVMALVVLPIVLVYIYRHRTQWSIALPLSFLAGGAIGNMIDRIYLGKVVDFLDFDFFDIDFLGFTLDRFWAFNIADSAITCSIIYLVITLLFFHKAHPEEALDPVADLVEGEHDEHRETQPDFDPPPDSRNR